MAVIRLTMNKANLSDIKKALKTATQDELIALVLRLSRHKVENKELLSYLLFYENDEESFIEDVKLEIDELFTEINTSNFYLMKKGIRKILRLIKKYIKFSKDKQTETALLLYFCQRLYDFKPSIKRSPILVNMYHKQLEMAEKAMRKLHEDLQFDYESAFEQLKRF